MPLDQMRLHLSHRVEHDANDDEQTGAAEELRRNGGHVQPLTEQARKNRNEREENSAGKSQPSHGEVQELRRRFARTHSWNVTAVLLQIIGDLRRLELRR